MLYNVSTAAAAKLLQSCPTLCDPRDGSPPGSPVPGILQARTLEWVASSFSNAWKWKVKVKSLSHVQLLATPWTTAYQAPPAKWISHTHTCIPSVLAFPFRSPQCITYRVPVKNLPVMQETWAWPQGWEDPLVKGLATHSSLLAGRIPRTEERGGLQSIGSQRVGLYWATNTHTHAADLAFPSL